MEYKELIKSAITALKSNILRTALTMLGIIIGITSVILIVSIGQGAVAFVTNELSSFGTNVFQINPGTGAFSAAVGADTLTLDDVEAIESEEAFTNIDKVVPVAVSTVDVLANGEDRNLIVNGTTDGALDVFKPDIIEGEFLTEENIAENDRVVVIGRDAAEDFFGENASVVGETLKVGGKTFRIVGVLRSDSALAGGVFYKFLFFAPWVVVGVFSRGGRS